MALILRKPANPSHHELVRTDHFALRSRDRPAFTHHASGRTSSGSPPVGGVPSGGWIAGSVPVNSRNSPASRIRYCAAATLRVSQPLNTADRPTSHNEFIMQRGSLLQPLAQQNAFCQGRLAARTGRLCSAVAALAGLSPSPARALTRHRASSASFFLPCPDTQKRQTHPLDGFSSRRFLRKSLTPFSGESPASPRFPLGRSLRSRPHPFSPKLSRFRAAPSSRQKPRQPRVLTIKWGGGGAHSRAEPDENPSSGYLARVFSGPSSSVPANSRFLVGAPSTAPPAEDLPLLRHRRSGSPAGQGMLGRRTAPHFGDTAFRYAASYGQPSNVWKKSSAFFQPLERFLPTSGSEVSRKCFRYFRKKRSDKLCPDFFQGSEKTAAKVPTTGKNPLDFSNVWNRRPKIFQPSETFSRIFPMLGRTRRFSSKARKKSSAFFQPSERAASLRGKNFRALERGRLFLPTIGRKSSNPRTARAAGCRSAVFSRPWEGVPGTGGGGWTLKTHRLTGTLESFPFTLFHILGFPPEGPPFRARRGRAAPLVFHCFINGMKQFEKFVP